MQKQYKHLFFDLDHTLWDFDANARETLLELYDAYSLAQKGMPPPDLFIATYTRNNHALWARYHQGLISKEDLRKTRFRNTFAELGMDEGQIPLSFEEDYVRICPTKLNLFEDALSTLDYLAAKYTLHIITNGFYESSQLKLTNTGLMAYFDTVNISEVIGFSKPHPAIFEHALNKAGAEKQESMMIGDSLEADIAGAKAVGMDYIYFNPLCTACEAEIILEIKSLQELKHIL